LSEHKKNSSKSGGPTGAKEGSAGPLPKEALLYAKREIEERFRGWAFALVSAQKWDGYRKRLLEIADREQRRRSALHTVWLFACEYVKLLERAMAEHVELLTQTLLAYGTPRKRIEWQEVLEETLEFTELFTMGEYTKPWTGTFLLLPRSTDPHPKSLHAIPDAHVVRYDFQMVVTSWFDEWAATTEDVQERFSCEVCSKDWRNHAADRARNQFQLVSLVGRSTRTDLTERERKMWEVISRGVKGLQYCRELQQEGIGPRRTGSWRGAPSTYPAAYKAGEPWRHRIQDEKSKIKYKAQLASE
jgi:hypothetical protein